MKTSAFLLGALLVLSTIVFPIAKVLFAETVPPYPSANIQVAETVPPYPSSPISTL